MTDMWIPSIERRALRLINCEEGRALRELEQSWKVHFYVFFAVYTLYLCIEAAIAGSWFWSFGLALTLTAHAICAGFYWGWMGEAKANRDYRAGIHRGHEAGTVRFVEEECSR